MSLYLYPLALLAGVLFNLNPSCGSSTLIWTSTQTKRYKLAALALIRILLFITIGALAGYFGKSLRTPWGVLMLIGAVFLLYTTIKQVRARSFGVCYLPGKTSALLPWVLAIIPPPSAYIGLAFFFGDFNAPSAQAGAIILGLIAIGLTLPVWLFILKPTWWNAWKNHLARNPKTARTQITFQFVGIGLMTVIGLAFVFLQNFHRPLLYLVGLFHN